MKRLLLLAGLLVSMFLVGACGASPSDEALDSFPDSSCSSDSDCGGGRVCGREDYDGSSFCVSRYA